MRIDKEFQTRITCAVAALVLIAAGTAKAQLPIPPSTQFDVVGYLEEATLDLNCAADAHCGGTIKVQGHTIVVPKETVVLLPANALLWQELFAQAPAPYGFTAAGGAMTGLAAADLPAPLNNYEVHVVGNRVINNTQAGAPADAYIAGLVYITSHGLNSGNGFINFIDYTLGELRVGGILNDPNCIQGGTVVTAPLCSGARVRINDPSGRFGRATTLPDPRFGVDPENPTIMAGTGFPMCLPRTDPAVADDALCPQAQRTINPVTGGFAGTIFMNDPAVVPPPIAPDANVQVPLEVGDYVFFAGVVNSDVTGIAGPWPTAPVGNTTASTYVAAWSITNNIAVYTAPGANPAYVMIEVALVGTGGLSVLGAGEATARSRIEGMATDSTRKIHLSAVDFAPGTGTVSDRDYGSIMPDPGAPVGAVRGRWRFRPPCDPFGTAPANATKTCVMNQSNTFLPPSREIRAVIENAWTAAAPIVAANGITTGQYRNPAIEYIFPENIPGTPIVENNFNTIAFLAQGGYPSSTTVVSGILNPWPSSILPSGTCIPPVANAGGSYTVAAGSTVTLAGSSTGTAPVTLLWTASTGIFTTNGVGNAVYSSVGAISPVTATLTATNACGSSSATATITVNGATPPTVAHVLPISVFSGAPGSFGISATDPANEAIRFTVTQAGAPALVALTVTPPGFTGPPSVATVTFTAPVLPLGQILPTVINISITATDLGGAISAPEFTTVTVNPLPDSVAVTAAQYRTGKRRLDVTATSTVVSPNVVLTLDPYVTTTGVLYDPSPASGGVGNTFTNTGGGIYTITLVQVPQPGAGPVIRVRSNVGGVSPLATVSIRQ